MKESACMKYYFRVNGQLVLINNPSQIMLAIFSSISNLEYWSQECLKKLYLGIIEMVCEYCGLKVDDLNPGESKRMYNHFVKRQSKNSRWMPNTQEGMVRKIYETILSGEGMGLNRGHGFGNKFGDNIKGNSDLQRLSKDHTIEEKLNDKNRKSI
ncbi:hypothetical protein LCGC14_0458350 [marine sediment metagenome]|uniref:Uncharacterized protein n=1 Tax=marine sediment metagenome TaxID=412755 RepID=A0A0F9V2F1_9ZZZZ